MAVQEVDAAETTQEHDPDLRRPARPALLAAALLAALAAALVGLTIGRSTAVSPYDEATHADYAWRIAHGQVPARGTPVAPEILHEWACRGGAALTPDLSQWCHRTDLVSTSFPNHGEDYNFGHPPVYYAITGGLARIADAVAPGDHFFQLARLTGILWLWAAMLVLYLAVREFGTSPGYAALAAGLLPLGPGVLYACSTVTNDAAAPLAGALALLVFARLVVKNRTGWILPTVTTLFVAGTKIINLVPLLAVAVAFLLLAAARWRSGEREGARPPLFAGVGMFAATGVVYLGWGLFQSGRGVANWVNPVRGISGKPVVGEPFRELTSTFLNGMSPESSYFLPRNIDGQLVTLWSRALSVAIVAAPFMLIAVYARRSVEWTVGMVTLAGMLAYPLIVEAEVYLNDHDYFPAVSTRYGRSVEPLALACIAMIAWRRGARWVATLGACVGAAAMFVTVGGLVN